MLPSNLVLVTILSLWVGDPRFNYRVQQRNSLRQTQSSSSVTWVPAIVWPSGVLLPNPGFSIRRAPRTHRTATRSIRACIPRIDAWRLQDVLLTSASAQIPGCREAERGAETSLCCRHTALVQPGNTLDQGPALMSARETRRSVPSLGKFHHPPLEMKRALTPVIMDKKYDGMASTPGASTSTSNS